LQRLRMDLNKSPGPLSFLSQSVTVRQCKDSGMMLVLICLIAGHYSKDGMWEIAAISFLVADLLFPSIYKPLARFWFGIGHILGIAVSSLLLSLVYFLLVTPVGMVRRFLGADPLLLKSWKAHSRSVFSVRNHVFGREDLEKPY